MTALAAGRDQALVAIDRSAETLVTMYLERQMFGMPVLRVRDILIPERIFSIPLAPPEVAGSINLRGRVVTVIDLRTRLGLGKRVPARGPGGRARKRMCVTVEHRNELYGLLVDDIGDVMALSPDLFENNPSTLDSVWQGYSVGVYRLPKALLIDLDLDRVLEFVT